MHWVAVNTKPHREKQAEMFIRQCGVECFLPLIKESKIIRRVRKTVVSPLFPGYLFARLDPMRHCRVVKYARGVRNVVEFGSSVAIIDDYILDSIRSRLVNDILTVPKDSFRIGQVLRIGYGPLEGLEAVFERKLSGPQRVVLLLQAIKFQARLIVPLKLVSNE